jgi:hypothetical protein
MNSLIMKQPKVKIIDNNQKDCGVRPIRSSHWDNNGFCWVIMVDFMGDNNSNEYLAMYQDTEGNFISSNKNLTGKIQYD